MNAIRFSFATLFATSLLFAASAHAEDPQPHQILEAVEGVPDTHTAGHGRISTASIAATFGASDDAIRACAPRKTYVLVVEVDSTGQVESSQFIRHSLTSEEETCITAIVSALTFEPPTPENTSTVISRTYRILPE